MDSMSKPLHPGRAAEAGVLAAQLARQGVTGSLDILEGEAGVGQAMSDGPSWSGIADTLGHDFHIARLTVKNHVGRSEEHTSELQSLMRISYAVFCLKKKKQKRNRKNS